MANELQEKLNAILEDKNTNLIPGNIKRGHSCLGVDGTWGITNTEQYQTCNRLANVILGNHKMRVEDYTELDKYELLDYIESTGEQYITLGSCNRNIKYDVEIIGQFTDLNHTILNADGSENSLHAIGIAAQASSTNRLLYVGYDKHFGNNLCYSVSGREHVDTVVKCDENIHSYCLSNYGTITNDQLGFFVDGKLINEETNTNVSAAIYKCKFGVFGYENSDGFQCTKFRLYRLRIYKNGVLLYNVYPVKRKEDGVVGLLDLDDFTFKTNEGTGEFLYKEL